METEYQWGFGCFRILLEGLIAVQLIYQTAINNLLTEDTPKWFPYLVQISDWQKHPTPLSYSFSRCLEVIIGNFR